MDIKEIRKTKKLTQVEASKLTNIPLRTFKLYENDRSKVSTIKYDYIAKTLLEYNRIDEEHGILSLEEIQKICSEVFSTYDVDFAILFGSYAKGNPYENSDVDILISTNVTGLEYFGLVEKLRESLNKKVDLLNLEQLNDNPKLTYEILKSGVKIYESKR